jgi:hypothetical protein
VCAGELERVHLFAERLSDGDAIAVTFDVFQRVMTDIRAAMIPTPGGIANHTDIVCSLL